MYNITFNGSNVIFGNTNVVMSGEPPTPPVDPQFQMEINVPSNGLTFRIEHVAGYTHNYIVYWGDGTSSVVTSSNIQGHTYPTAGTWVISISGICESIDFSLNPTSNRLRKLLSWGNIGLKYINFYNCISLTSICGGGGLENVTSLPAFAFGYCTSLTTIAPDLFKYSTSITSFPKTFYNDNTLTTIPTDFFRYNTNVTNFDATFGTCLLLNTIPTDLFKYNTKVTSFNSTFSSCYALPDLPSDFFRYNTEVSDFTQVFNNCRAFTNVSTDIFRYNTKVTNFSYTFANCIYLSTVPNELFKYNTSVSSFEGCFDTCFRLQINPWTFYVSGESSTRFNGKTVSFKRCFKRTSWLGTTKGTAPDLWNCTGLTPTTTECFRGNGNSSTSINNYASIPVNWL